MRERRSSPNAWMLRCASRVLAQQWQEYMNKPIGPQGLKVGFHTVLLGVNGGGAGQRCSSETSSVYTPRKLCRVWRLWILYMLAWRCGCLKNMRLRSRPLRIKMWTHGSKSLPCPKVAKETAAQALAEALSTIAAIAFGGISRRTGWPAPPHNRKGRG